MKRAIFVTTILISGILIQAQDTREDNYIQDTIWLKTGLIMPCMIITDSINSDYIVVNYKNAVGHIDKSNVKWNQIVDVHKQSKPYIPISSTYIIELTNGTTFTGELLEETETEIKLQLEEIGFLSIKKSNIEKIIPVQISNEVKKSYWFKNPHATRLLFAPTAIPLKKGEGYYQNIYVVGNMFNYGVGNKLSIGGGFDFITMFATIQDGWSPMLNFNIKSGFQIKDNLHVGVGGIYVTMPGEFSAGIAYGLGTIGSYNSNLTLGLGWGFVDDSFEEKPFIMIGGMVRVSEKLWFVSENWIAPVDGNNYYTVVSYGMRFAAKKIAVDLAFLNSKDIIENIFIGIPFVDFVIKFGE